MDHSDFYEAIENCSSMNELKALEKILERTNQHAFWESFEKAQNSEDRFEKRKALLMCRFLAHENGFSIPVTPEIHRFFAPAGLRNIVISQHSKIGPGCTIFPDVLIGYNTILDSKHSGFPVIEDHVYIGAGAVIIGGVTIGSHARIGANCVVVDNVPANAVVVSSENRVIQKEKLVNKHLPIKEYIEKEAERASIKEKQNAFNDAKEHLKSGDYTVKDLAVYLKADDTLEALQPVLDRKPVLCTSNMKIVKKDAVFFAAAKSTNHDDRVREAMKKGCVAVVAGRQVKDENGKELPCIICKAPYKASHEVSALIKSGKKARTIAVTGSIGKTTTKDMIRYVTQEHFKTEYSVSNANGFARVIENSQKLDPSCEIYIQETGISKPNSLERASKVLIPDFFVLTNIGTNHIGYFGGKKENILHEKLALDRNAAEDAVGFVNWDDDLIRNASFVHRVITFGVEHKEADYYAENIVEKDFKLSFDMIEKASGIVLPISLSVPGKHNVLNALCAYAIGKYLGMEESEIKRGLESYRSVGVRQNLVWLNGHRVYLDCYNASEGAIASVSTTLSNMETANNGKKILVLGDIDDKLGDRTEEIHRNVGIRMSALTGIDYLLCFGGHAKWVGEEVEKNSDRISVFRTEDRSELEAYIQKILGPDDIIAFKGGQQMMLSLTVDNLFGTSFFMLDGDVWKAISTTKTIDGHSYRLTEGYGAILRKAARDMKEVKLPETVEGMPLRVILQGAFSNSEVEEVILPEGLTCIEKKAFENCHQLKKIILPSTLKYVGSGAFGNCENLTDRTAFSFVESMEPDAFEKR